MHKRTTRNWNTKEHSVRMKISNPEFEAAIGALKASLHKLQIPNKDQKELSAIVEEHSTTDRHAEAGVGEE